MFTNNYLKFRKSLFVNDYEYFVNCEGTSVVGYASYSYFSDFGVLLNKAYCKEATANVKLSSRPGSIGSNGGVYFGAGSTPVTKNDYKLDSPITSGLSITNPNIDGNSDLWSVSDGKYVYTVTYTVKNTSDSEINIWEIGVFGEVTEQTITSYPAHTVLFERTVFSEPVTIAPGQIKVITYKLTFNQTLNVE
jgi:hypothetical protein